MLFASARLSRRAISVVVVALVVAALAVWPGSSAHAAATRRALLLEPTTIVAAGQSESLEQQEAEADGLAVDVVSNDQWAAMTAADFAKYAVIILGDPACSDSSVYSAAIDNRDVWEKVVLGSGGTRVLVGTDPSYHYYYGGRAGDVLDKNTIALAASTSGATGLLWNMSCSGSALGPDLDGLTTGPAGSFSMTGDAGNAVSIVADSPALTSLTDTALSNWSSSVHESFSALPSDYVPLALLTDGFTTASFCGTDIDTSASVCGNPYIAVAGSGIAVTSADIAVTPDQSVRVGTSTSVTATITSGGSPVAGQSVTFTVSAGPDTGKTVTLTTGSDGKATFTFTPGTAGTDTVAASIVNSLGQSETSNTTVTITSAPPVLVATATPTPIDYGSDVTLGFSGLSTSATGTVTFTAGGDTLCSVDVTTSSSCSPSTPPAPGTYAVTASYSGDGSNDPQTATTSFKVDQATPSVTAGVDNTSVPYGTAVTLSLAGVPSDATGTVTFTAGGKTLCEATLPATSCSTSATLGVDTYDVTATYGGDDDYTSASDTTSFSVSKTAVATMTVSATPSTIEYLQPTTLTYGGLPADATGTVVFTVGDQDVCTLTIGDDTSCTAGSQLAPGDHKVSAKYSGDANYDDVTTTTTFTVVKADTTLVAEATPNPAVFGQPVSLSYSGLPDEASGTVTFSSGGTTLCVVTLGANSCDVTSVLSAGSHDITASYSGDDNFAASAADEFTLTVAPAGSPEFSANATPNTAPFGTADTLSYGGLPKSADGKVTFTVAGVTAPARVTAHHAAAGSARATKRAGRKAAALLPVAGTVLCVVELEDGTSCAAPSDLAPGGYSVLATYSGDADHAPATANTSFTVTKASTADLFAASATPSKTTFAMPTTVAYGGIPLDATGTVTFTANGATLCTVTVGSALGCLTPAGLDPGTYHVTATYSGDANYSPATATTSFTIAKADTNLTVTAPGKAAYGAHVTLAASGLPSGARGTVTFTAGGKTLCVLTLPATTCRTSSLLTAGKQTITATYSGSADYAASSDTAKITVAAEPVKHETGPATLEGHPVSTTVAIPDGGHIVLGAQPSTGTAKVHGKTITFTPNSGFVGTAHVTYEIIASDGTRTLVVLAFAVKAPAATTTPTSTAPASASASAASSTTTAAAASTAGALPFTGSQVGPLLGIAATLLLLGLACTVIGRRRGAHH